jgi:ribosomal protein L3
MTEQNNSTPSTSTNEDLKLDSLLTFKLGMTQFVDEKGEMIPCTVLKYEPMTVAQVKVDTK